MRRVYDGFPVQPTQLESRAGVSGGGKVKQLPELVKLILAVARGVSQGIASSTGCGATSMIGLPRRRASFTS